jgi:acetyl-CoA acyltransferase 1
MESMTQHYGPGAMPTAISENVMSCSKAQDCLLPMGMTSENVSSQFNIGREAQDKFSVLSHEKATAAQEKGYFKDEIVPVAGCSADDGIRKGVTVEILSKLKPAFKEDGSTTAGSASQVSDGAAAVLFMKRKTAKSLGLKVLAKWISFAVVGGNLILEQF